MRGLHVLTMLCTCAALESAAAQVPEPPAAPLPAPAPLAVPAPSAAFDLAPIAPAPRAAPAPAPAAAALPGLALDMPPAPPASQAPPATPAPQAPQKPQTTPQPPRPRATPQAPQAPAAPAPPPAPVITVEPPLGQLVNIQVDVTITAEVPGQPAVKKVVSLTVADRQNAMVRSNESRNIGFGDTLNVDVRPSLQRNGHILIGLGVEYANAKEPPVVQLRAQPLLEPGRSLLISRAASPNGDRTVTVEVVARVLK